MRLRTVLLIGLCLCFAGVLLARQSGTDPISGAWFGFYGTTPRDQSPVRAMLNWDGKKALTGSVTTGDDPFDLENSTFDPGTGAVHMEVTVPGRGGRMVYHYMIDGKLEKNAIS